MISYFPHTPASPTKPRDIMRVLARHRPTARRALTDLGLNNPKDNLKMADDLLTQTSLHFAKKWKLDQNLDPLTHDFWVKGEVNEPLQVTGEGREVYHTSSVTQVTSQQPRCQVKRGKVTATGGGGGGGVVATTPRSKQCKITEFGRQRKRLHSSSSSSPKCKGGEDEVLLMTTGARKKLHLSPTKTSSSSSSSSSISTFSPSKCAISSSLM